MPNFMPSRRQTEFFSRYNDTAWPTVPDYAEPIMAWRVWHGDALDPQLYGTGVGSRYEWPMYAKSVAAHLGLLPCAADGPPCRSCGIFGIKDRAWLVDSLPQASYVEPKRLVVGRVALWGRIVEHEHGYRAQYAYPASLACGADAIDVEALARAYGVPYEEDLSWKSVLQSAGSSASPWSNLFPFANPMVSLAGVIVNISNQRANPNPSPSPLILSPAGVPAMRLIKQPRRPRLFHPYETMRGRLYRPRGWFKDGLLWRRLTVDEWLAAKRTRPLTRAALVGQLTTK